MRAGRTVVLAALVLGLMAAPAGATSHFSVGQGRDPGVAIDAAGTSYIGWQVNTYADAGDAVQLCVLPAGARVCASLATIAFPGSGYNIGQVSVLLPSPGVVEVAVGRNLQNVYGYYLGTSVDGGATFNVPIRIGGEFAKRAELLPGPPGARCAGMRRRSARGRRSSRAPTSSSSSPGAASTAATTRPTAARS